MAFFKVTDANAKAGEHISFMDSQKIVKRQLKSFSPFLSPANEPFPPKPNKIIYGLKPLPCTGRDYLWMQAAVFPLLPS